MTDWAGNTGQIYEYNNKGQIIKITSFDENGEIKKHKDGYAIGRFEYDIHSNIIKTLFFDEKENPCEASGCYGFRTFYNIKGKVIKQICLDKDGVSPMKDFLIVEYKYDDHGNMVQEAYYDTSNHYANSYTWDRLAKKTLVYDGDKVIEEKKFTYDDFSDSLILNYYYKAWLNSDKKEIVKLRNDTAEILSYDNHGKQNSLAIYILQGKYEDLDLNDKNFWENNKDKFKAINNQKEELISYHKWVDSTEYKDTITQTRAFIDSLNAIIKYKEIKKYNGREISVKYFDSKKAFQYATRLSYNVAGYNNTISYIGISGIPFRNPNYIFSAYKIKYSLNINGEILAWAAYNEYGEKSYTKFIYNTDYVFHKLDTRNFKVYDLDSTEITNMDSFTKSLKKMYFFCYTPETQPEAKGKLRDGDIIVGYGKWKYNGSNVDELNTEYNRIIDSSKMITLLRLPEEKLIKVKAPSHNFNLFSDYFYLTDKENKRIKEILRKMSF